MAGLFDALESDQGLLGLALLQAASPKPVRTGLGEGLLGGLQLVQQQRNQREDRAQRQRMQQMQEQALLAQLDERKRAAEEAARQAAERQRIQQVISGAFSPTQPIQANAASGVAGPRPEALGVVGQRRPVDFQMLVAQGVPPDLAKNLAEAQNWGRPKVARTIEEAGPNGPTTVQFDDYGNRVGGGIAKPVQLQAQDLGGRVAPWNPFAIGNACAPSKWMIKTAVSINPALWPGNTHNQRRATSASLRLATHCGSVRRTIWKWLDMTEEEITEIPKYNASSDILSSIHRRRCSKSRPEAGSQPHKKARRTHRDVQ